MLNKRINDLLTKNRAIAEQVGQSLAKHPSVMAVVVFGSVASGHVDVASDVDLLVICTPDIPALEARRILVSHLSGSALSSSEGDMLFPVIDEISSVEGVAVTLHYQRALWIEQVLDEVLTQGALATEQLPFRPYTLAGLLQRAWIITDKESLVTRWQKRLTTFPKVLKQNLISHFTPILHEQVAEFARNAERHMGARAAIFNLN